MSFAATFVPNINVQGCGCGQGTVASSRVAHYAIDGCGCGTLTVASAGPPASLLSGCGCGTAQVTLSSGTAVAVSGCGCSRSSVSVTSGPVRAVSGCGCGSGPFSWEFVPVSLIEYSCADYTAAGGGQSGATLLADDHCAITSVPAANDGVILPDGCYAVQVSNQDFTTFHQLDVYPPVGHLIYNLGINNPALINAGSTALFVYEGNGRWAQYDEAG
jgi:hypothetical protein